MIALQATARLETADQALLLGASLRRARSIGSFEATAQKQVLRIAAGVPALEDLACSFPALLYALATGFGTAEARAATIALVRQGAPLRHAAMTLGLPWWLRRVPAAALSGSLAGLPAEADHARALTAFVPADPVAARAWLGTVAYACRAAGAPFGVWLGGSLSRFQGALIAPGSDSLRLLAAWAWASEHRETALGALVRRPWMPGAGPRRAFDELIVWRQRIYLELLLGSRAPDISLRAGEAHGLAFVPLRSAREFIAESVTMDNCLDQYGERLAERRSHIVSIRRNGRPVADVEIGRHEEEEAIAAIRQLRGQRNRRAGADIWRAAYAWLATQSLGATSSTHKIDTGARREAAQRLWHPYLADREEHLTATELRELSAMIGIRPVSSSRKRRAVPVLRQPAVTPAKRQRSNGTAMPAEA